MLKRLTKMLILIGGLLGIAVCLAGIAVVWNAGGRLLQANAIIFDRIDKSLAAANGRVSSVQNRAQELKLTTEEIEQSVKEWLQLETAQRLGRRSDVVLMTEKVSFGLQQADEILELAAATVDGVQQAMEPGISIGIPFDPAFGDSLSEQLAISRTQLDQIAASIVEIREGAAAIATDEIPSERLNKFAQLAVHVVATLGEVDVRLGNARSRLAEARTQLQQLESRTRRWLVAGKWVVVLIIGWMASGQVFLCALSLFVLQREAPAAPEGTAHS